MLDPKWKKNERFTISTSGKQFSREEKYMRFCFRVKILLCHLSNHVA